MPWKARSTLDERKVFLEEWRKQETSFAELCREFQVSRQTGYKWLGRYEAEGERNIDQRDVGIGGANAADNGIGGRYREAGAGVHRPSHGGAVDQHLQYRPLFVVGRDDDD